MPKNVEFRYVTYKFGECLSGGLEGPVLSPKDYFF